MRIVTPDEELMELEHNKLILEKRIEIAKLKVELWYLEYDLYLKEIEKQPSIIPWPIPGGTGGNPVPLNPYAPTVTATLGHNKEDASTISI